MSILRVSAQHKARATVDSSDSMCVSVCVCVSVCQCVCVCACVRTAMKLYVSTRRLLQRLSRRPVERMTSLTEFTRTLTLLLYTQTLIICWTREHLWVERHSRWVNKQSLWCSTCDNVLTQCYCLTTAVIDSGNWQRWLTAVIKDSDWQQWLTAETDSSDWNQWLTAVTDSFDWQQWLTAVIDSSDWQRWLTKMMKHMRYVIHLKLATDSFKCDSTCVSWLEFSIYFNFCRSRALAHTTLGKLWVVFFIFNSYRSQLRRP